MIKIAYLGIDALFPVLLAARQENCEILHIFTCPCDNVTEFNTQILTFAARNAIPCTTRRITGEDLHRLALQGCELLLCAGYYHRVPPTDAFPMVNVHPAPLPDCRGAWPMPLLLLDAAPEGAVALHKMAQNFDTGDILLQKSFALHPEDTLTDYMHRACALLPGLVHTLLCNLPRCLQNAQPQGEGRYLPCPTEADWTINSTMTAAEADRILRAFYSYECIYEGAHGRRLELIGARADTEHTAPNDLPLQDGWVHAPRMKELTLCKQ